MTALDASAGGAAGRTVVAQEGRPAQRRADIQGLRAVAVLLVLAYHLRPDLVPGGFVGVDVFFVVSGFLIIGSLTREAGQMGTVRLARFYAHRVRRLLPLSSLVIVTTLVTGLLLLPQTRWSELGRSAIASALQVQNLDLAFGKSQYEAASTAVSPFQHFWSLSIEEQFYLVVPLLVLIIALVARRRGWKVRTALVGLFGVVGVTSLLWSVYYTEHAAGAAAYYSTTTRVWELALGGLTAVLVRDVTHRTVAWLLGAIGLVLVLGSAFVLDGVAGFPGWVALVPTLGTAMLLVAGSGGAVGVSRVLSTSVPRKIGDMSYSLYLWHWPIIVYFFVLTGDTGISWREACALVALSLVLSYVSERYVERPFRKPWTMRLPVAAPRHGRLRITDRATIGLGMGLVVVALTVAVLPVVHVQRVTAAAGGAADIATDPEYPGAQALIDPTVADRLVEQPVRPDPLAAAKDIPPAYTDGCNGSDLAALAADRTLCRYGADPATMIGDVVIVGDSHAAQLSTPVAAAAEAEGRSARLLFKDGCPFSLDLGKWPEQSCVDHNRQVLAQLTADPPAVVVVANLSREGYEQALQWGWPDAPVAVDGFHAAWEPLLAQGTRVVYVRPLPFPTVNVPECVSQFGRDAERCEFAPPTGEDYGVQAAESLDGVQTLDLTSSICEPETCRPVVGNVLVFRDNHLTESYASTLGPGFADVLAGGAVTG
ncbi:acyltransferase family protein [Oerskovia sp. KBS0722]|uniref:acyltransferase family protein n=1 Tax=Oerskovia sp. KBS0722 TaxID=1179673 RepID=UPI00143D9A98|nr:acyltransferase family protein [Oerskovia sp. KBS0722]